MSAKKSRVPRLFLPMRQPEDVILHLGKPSHWKEGRSAKSVATAWFASNDFPDDVREILETAEEFAGIQLVDCFLERMTDLDDGRATASQTDLLAIGATNEDLVIIGVEAKVTESFGPYVGDWRDGSTGKEQRLAKLCDRLGFDMNSVNELRYQLFHRTVSAILEARRYRARHAIMLIQSFCPQHTGHQDFLAFTRKLGLGDVSVGELSEPIQCNDVNLRLGWLYSQLPASMHEGSIAKQT